MCVCTHAMFLFIARNLDLAKCSASAIVAEAHVVHYYDPDPHGVGDQVLRLHYGVCRGVGVGRHVVNLGDLEPHGVGGHHGDGQVLGDQVLDHAHTGQKIASEYG